MLRPKHVEPPAIEGQLKHVADVEVNIVNVLARNFTSGIVDVAWVAIAVM